MRYVRVVLALVGVCLLGSPVFADAVVLNANKTAIPGEVHLSWSGGVPTYTVYRGAAASTAGQPANTLGTTGSSAWLDTPPGTVAFFLVTSPCTAAPPAVCCTNDAGCLSSEYCDGSTSTCTVKKALGAVCAGSNGCQSGNCVDGVCCGSTCAGTCRACDLAGNLGSCTNASFGTDPDDECGFVGCSGYFWGFGGDSCFRAADVFNGQCDGAAACKTQAQECTASSPGTIASTCHPTCQDPAPGTCTGTTPGACSNVNPGNQSCGTGACLRTVAQCVNGAPNSCVPGNPSAETCNDIDDNCDGPVDNGNFADGFGFNDDCSLYSTLNSANDNATGPNIYNSMTLYPSGDVDFYRIQGIEAGSTCACCDGFFCTDEDFRLTVSLTVPPGAGSYELCLVGSLCPAWTNCVAVAAGNTGSVNWAFDGSCATADNFSYYVRVRGSGAPAFECRPYTLQYQNVQGCF